MNGFARVARSLPEVGMLEASANLRWALRNASVSSRSPDQHAAGADSHAAGGDSRAVHSREETLDV